jgi:hypothetical protein
VDHSLRRVKQNPVFKKRFKLFAERKILIKKLGKAGRFGQIKVFSAGMLPSLLFGAECNTPPLKNLTQCRIGLVQVRGLALPGVAHQLALLALPPQCDPMEQVLEAALYRWHREVWLHTKQHPSHADRLSLHQLQLALSAGQELAKGLEWDLRGPVFAVIRAVRAVGWELRTAVSLRTEDGQIWSLKDGSPAMLKHLYRKRWIFIQGMQAFGHRFGHCLGYPGEAETLLDKGLDMLPLKRAFLSKGKQGLNHGEKRCLLKFLSGTTGNFGGELCSLCGETDTTHHRLWECSHPEVLAFRESFLQSKPGLRTWLALSKTQGDHHMARDKGWFPAAVPHLRPQWETHVVFPTPEDGEFRFLPGLPIYSDGSCYNGTDNALAVAGAALVQLRDGAIVRSLQVCLPCWIPATAAAGEHMAPALANLYTTGDYELVTDCSSVFSSATKGAGFALHWSRPMAGMWQDVRFHNITAHKTKAHRSKKQATLQGDLQEWIGNDVVDDLAKEAAAMGAPSKEVVSSRELDVANRVAFYHFAAKLLKLWVPNLPLPHRAKSARPAKTVAAHHLEWLPFLHKWGCGQCLRKFKTRASSAGSTCSGFSQAAMQAVSKAQEHGHRLLVCSYLQSAGSFLYCNRCGCYSQVRVMGLGRTCLGKAGSQLHRLHKHIQAGRHPTTGALLGKPRFLPAGDFGPVPDNGPSQIEEASSQALAKRLVVLPLTSIPGKARQEAPCGIWDEDYEFSPDDQAQPQELEFGWDQEF